MKGEEDYFLNTFINESDKIQHHILNYKNTYNRNEEQFPSSDMGLFLSFLWYGPQKKMAINWETKGFSVTLETGMMTYITVTV